MSIYKDLDRFVIESCVDYLDGKISVGFLKKRLLSAAYDIVSLEDRELRAFLYNCEAEIDGVLALNYGAEGIGKLDYMFITKDINLKKITEKIVQKILNRLEDEKRIEV